MRALSIFEGLAGDFRFSFRILTRHRMFAAACILTVALGIGATTAVFSVVDATLLRPLPYRNPERLVGVNAIFTPTWNGDFQSLFGPSQIELVRWRAAKSFESIEAIEPRIMTLTGRGDAQVINGGLVSSGLFPMLGIAPLAGRVFTAEEENSGAGRVVIGDAFRSRYFSTESPIGKQLVLDGAAYEV